MRVKHADYDLKRRPTETPFYLVSADSPTTVFEVRTDYAKAACMNLKFQRLRLQERAKVSETRLVSTTRRRKHRTLAAPSPQGPERLLRRYRKKRLDRPISIALVWVGRPDYTGDRYSGKSRAFVVPVGLGQSIERT